MQEFALFQNHRVQICLKQVLYIWAMENPEYQYQQGMNEILAVIMVALSAELIFGDLNSELSGGTEA